MHATTKLTTKGQVVIPKRIRDRLRWMPGMRLEVKVLSDGGISLKRYRRGGTLKEALEIIDQLSGCITSGDPVGELEAEHRAEVEADERLARDGRYQGIKLGPGRRR
jgi:AbrB family looped-hinge helix DNA binding protein